jgi:hypothetical protein
MGIWNAQLADLFQKDHGGKLLVLKLPTHVNGETIASFLSRVPKQKDPERQALLEKYLEELKSTPPPVCYYCTKKNFQSKIQYERHVLFNHNGKLAYPNLPYLEAMNLKPQGCLWEE